MVHSPRQEVNYQDFARIAVDAVGGPDNIRQVTHCTTRLRFNLVNPSRADKETLQTLPEAAGVVDSGGQLQVIIGMHVPEVHAAVAKQPGVRTEISYAPSTTPPAGNDFDQPNSAGEPPAKKSILDSVLAAISAIFTPYIPVLASMGIIQGLLAVTANLGWLATDSDTYIILNAAPTALLYFFPILLAFTAAKQFGANPYIGAVIGAALLEPNLAGINQSGDALQFLGISFVGQSFANTVIPIILGMLAFSYLERGLKTILPPILHILVVPLVCMLVMVPAMLLIFGPIGFSVASGVLWVYQALMHFPLVLSLLFGGFFVFVIVIGAHWLVTPLLLSILAEQGYEYALAAGGMGNYAILGVLVAVLITTKDPATRTVASSAAFVNGVAGVTEPGIYGVIIKNKLYLGLVVVGGLAGGLICGLFDVYVTAFAFSGVLGAPAFLASPRAVPYFVAVAVSLIVPFVLTIVLERRGRRMRDGVRAEVSA